MKKKGKSLLEKHEEEHQVELTEQEQIELAQKFEKAKSRKIAQMFNELN